MMDLGSSVLRWECWECLRPSRVQRRMNCTAKISNCLSDYCSCAIFRVVMADYTHSPSITPKLSPAVTFSFDWSPKNPDKILRRAPSEGFSNLNSALAWKANLFLKSYESSLVY